MQVIRTLIVDDHAIVRAGVKMLLGKQQDIEVVGEAADGQEAIEKALSLKPDLVIMDLSMPPGKNGLEATRELKQSLPDTHVLILTMHDDENYLFRVLQAGASGYVLKNALDSELLSAVDAVSQGRAYLHPSAAKSLVEDFLSRVNEGEDLSSYKRLSNREEEILTFIAKGYSNKEIAETLYISVKTVESHKSKIMDKLGLHKRHELVTYAMKKGLLDLG
ncbi:response regulator [Bacillus thermotolerans]|uniref:Two-component response regulator n=1 Tax=Bacillus thermotolerans TaxID=1221996 RepID=A0A0F5HMS4_BACTR|nr:response regulator transcription factor [Bacillus thermotolerans]KKB34350.1 Two-component response regulator [Bacillus thermotolerans]KKB41104.1 Two-component response regulator [Bacillus thermotolerans]